jgi:hypothetical protein
MHKYKEMKFMTLSLQAGIKYFSFIYIALFRKKKPHRVPESDITGQYIRPKLHIVFIFATVQPYFKLFVFNFILKSRIHRIELETTNN